VQAYSNLSGNSGVVAFETGPDFIRVQFVSGDTYLYTYRSASAPIVEEMKVHAVRGKGLSTFISTTVKGGYADKSR
jgi:hypothetical protein